MYVVLYVAITLIVIWFGQGIIRKLGYAAKVERELIARQIYPTQIEKVVGRSRYANALFYLKKESVSPRDTAGLLELYVVKAYGVHCTSIDIDPKEKKLLEILGYLK